MAWRPDAAPGRGELHWEAIVWLPTVFCGGGGVERSETLKPESAALLEAALMRGEIERGAAPGIMGLPERTARRVLNVTIAARLFRSSIPRLDRATAADADPQVTSRGRPLSGWRATY